MTALQTLSLIAFAGILLYAGRRLPLGALMEDKSRQHVVFGYAALLFILWIFRAGIFAGLDVHFLWLTAMTLTLGFRWALVAGTLSLVGTTAIGLDQWQMFGVNGLLGVAMPVALSYLVYMLSFYKIPRHLFVYIFICAFFPAALIITLKMLLIGGYYFADGIYSWKTITDNYLLLIPLLLFPEALLNGMTMTLLVIYKPEWVYTFHDKFYIDNK